MHGQLFNQLIVVQIGDQLISTKKAAHDDVTEIIHHVLKLIVVRTS
jgi:hypothetical protein